MQKSMQSSNNGGVRQYSCGGQVLRPLQASGNALYSQLDLIVGDNPPVHERTFETEWLGRAVYKVYTKHL